MGGGCDRRGYRAPVRSAKRTRDAAEAKKIFDTVKYSPDARAGNIEAMADYVRAVLARAKARNIEISSKVEEETDPFLALLTMGVIDLSQGLAERFNLQQSVNRGLELIQARPAEADADSSHVDYSFVKTEAAAAAGVPESQVTMTRWLECNGVDSGGVNGTCAEGQDTARYLRIRITKDFQGDFYFATIPMAASGTLRTQ